MGFFATYLLPLTYPYSSQTSKKGVNSTFTVLSTDTIQLFKKVAFFKHRPNTTAFRAACHDLLIHTDCSGLCSLDPA